MRDLQFIDLPVGMGRRVTVLQRVQKINRELPAEPVIVICPANMAMVWQDYLRRFGVKGEVVSYQRARRYCVDVQYKVEQNPSILVLDEPKMYMTGRVTREAIAPIIVAAEHVLILN